MLEGVVIALFGVALALLLVGAGLALLKLQFLSRAKRAAGTVVSLRPDGAAESGSALQLLEPVIRFSTTRGEGVEFVAGHATSPPPYRIGDTVAVRYDPGDPAGTARIESSRGLWLVPALMAGLSVPVALVAIGLLIWHSSTTEEAAEFRRTGTTLTGTIIRIDLADEASGADQPMFVLTVEANAPSDGRRLTFVSEPIEAAKRNDYAIGDRVPVILDPADPRRYRVELR